MGVGVVTLKNLEGLFRDFRAARKYRETPALDVLRAAARSYLILDGEVWVVTTEPAYRLTLKTGKNAFDLRTAVVSEPFNADHSAEYYSAEQWEDVMKVAKSRLKIRGEKDPDIGALQKIAVLMPEMVTVPRHNVQLFDKPGETITTANPAIGHIDVAKHADHGVKYNSFNRQRSLVATLDPRTA